ncbi:type II toxin-antitoxin system antitoxin HigA [Staphylococcus aureus]
MSISVGDKVYNHETNESLEIVQLVDVRDTHYKLSDDSVISIIDFITKPIYLIKGDE